MHRHLLTLAALVCSAALLGAAPGCTSANVAEGRYVEAQISGRWQAFDRHRGEIAGPMHFFRLNFLQFDEEVAGVIEVFRLRTYDSFLNQPLIVDQRRPADYFCTRVGNAPEDFARNRDDHLVARFTDPFSRQWQLEARFVADDLRGTISRVTAAGEVLPNPPPGAPMSVATPHLLEEDRRYYADLDLRDAYEPLVLERERDAIDRQLLDCVDYTLRDELMVRLPFDPPDDALMALVITRPERQVSGDAIGGLTAQEVLTITLDDIDLLDGERRVLVRIPPDFGVQSGVAVGTLIVYRDLPDADGARDMRWNNLLSTPADPEPVLAYGRRRLLVFNDAEQARALTALDLDGAPVGVCAAEAPYDGECLFEQRRQAGWSFYDYEAMLTGVSLDDGARVNLVRQLRGAPTDALTLDAVDAACALCYPAGAGDPPPACAASACPAILPLLYL